MLKILIPAAAAITLGLTLGGERPARAEGDGQVEALRGEIAALTKKVDDLGVALARADHRVADVEKKIDGLFYGSCPNRRLCGFH